MPIIRNALTLCAIAFIVSAAVAETDYSGWVYLTGKDEFNTKNSWASKYNWSDKKAPTSEKNYYVPAGTLLYKMHNNDKTTRFWGGGKLAVAGEFRINVSQGSGWAPYIADLILCPGSVVHVITYGLLSKADDNSYGKLTVEGTAINPSVITHQHANNGSARTFSLFCDVKGTANNVLVYERPDINEAGVETKRGWSVEGSIDTFNDYPGTFIVRGGTSELFPVDNSAFNWPLTALKFEKGATCKLYRKNQVNDNTTNAYLRSLTMFGGKLRYNFQEGVGLFPMVNVSECLALNEDTKIMVNTDFNDYMNRIPSKEFTATNYTIARLTGAAAENVGDLSKIDVVGTNSVNAYFPAKLSIVDVEEGVKDVKLNIPQIAIMTNNASQSSSGGAFCAGHGNDWTNGEVPSSEGAKHYWLAKSTYITDDITLPESILTVANTFNCVGGEM